MTVSATARSWPYASRGVSATAGISDVVDAASAGSDVAWSELVDRYDSLIGTVARSHRLNAADVAEVSQITWLRLVENIGRIQQPDRLRAWIVTTARRECLRILRHSSRSEPVAPESQAELDATDTVAPEERVLIREREVALRRAYGQLPPRCQVLLRLTVGEPDMSYKTLSEMLEMRIGSIGPTRGRCLEHLRRLLAECGLD